MALLAKCHKADDRGKVLPLIVVGQGIVADLGYLTGIGIDPANLAGFAQYVDTMEMHQSWRNLPNGRSLSHILGDLDIPHSYLHNAGNDAAYTLQAMLALAVSARVTELQETKMQTELNAWGPEQLSGQN